MISVNEPGEIRAHKKKIVANNLPWNVVIRERVDEGEQVKKGDLIIRFECKQLVDALEKARFAEKWIRERFKILGVEFEELRIDYIGVNTLHGEAADIEDKDYNEVGLRIAGKTKTREAAEVVRREATHLWTQGPIGSSFGTPMNVRPVIALWPTLVPRDAVRTESQLMEVK